MQTQTIDPAKPAWLGESSPIFGMIPVVVDDKLQTPPETLALLCAADEFGFWLKVQRGPLPEREVRMAKFIKFGRLCRSALHLPMIQPTSP
jgi:hypothetical protein